jgi:hypothetical protein
MGWSRSVALSALVLALTGCRERERSLGGYTEPPDDGIEIVCPVTGERCVKGPETEAAVFEMRSFYFCRPESRAVFVQNPKRYAYR